ncbi:MAG: tetratricopeptide repeat protein, partial [Candidatus Tectomicrobia bacterium]|nr:tetratricopeptide repeat protein [Candidatus Tectomicrobia bacterium]
GLVVVGEMGAGAHQEQLALGETPNVAARIQSLAAPDTVLLSAETYHLVQGYVTVEDCGIQTLRGVAMPMRLYRALRTSTTRGPLDVASARGLLPLVGRDAEVAQLLASWQCGQTDARPCVLIEGESGIGKSRLVEALRTHLTGSDHFYLGSRCSPYYQHTALSPVVEMLEHAAAWHPDDTPVEKLAKLEHLLSRGSLPLAEVVPLLAPLLSLPLSEGRYPQPVLTPQRQRQQTLATLVAWCISQSAEQPLLFVMEDLHWADPSTLEFLQLLSAQEAPARGLMVLTCRPGFQPLASWRASLTVMALPKLSWADGERLVTLLARGKTLPEEVVAHLVGNADGIPLFLEEMTKTLLESGVLQETSERYTLTGPLPPLAIPATLHDSLLARLDHLVTAKGLAQLGATLGRRFSYALLQAVAQIDAATLQRELDRLVAAELLYQEGFPPEATYTFKHALIQEAAYQSLLKRTRQQYHARTAQALVEQFPPLCASHPELVAHHYTEAGHTLEAIAYWQQAGEQALQRSATVESVAHLRTALDLLATLPEDAERQRQELHLLTALGPALVVLHGYAAEAVEQTYARARKLCQQVRDLFQLSQTLWGLWGFYLVRGELDTARDLAQQLFTLTIRRDEPALLLEVHRRLGTTTFYSGEIGTARAHLEQGIARYESQSPQMVVTHHALISDPGVLCRAFLAHTLWLLGYPEQALAQNTAALAQARALAHPFTLALALFYSTRLYQCLGDGESAEVHAEALLTLAREQHFSQWLLEGALLYGGALVAQGRFVEGIAHLHKSLDAWRETAGRLGAPWYLALLAQAYGLAGQPEQALHWLREALEVVEMTGERWWEAEIYRLTGEYLLQAHTQAHTSPPGAALWDEAIRHVYNALALAREQQVRILELRAAMSLSRLWQQQGKRVAAGQLLSSVLHWFTEGHRTPDLQEARACLATLRV